MRKELPKLLPESAKRTMAQQIRETLRDPHVVALWNAQAERIVRGKSRHLNKRQGHNKGGRQ